MFSVAMELVSALFSSAGAGDSLDTKKVDRNIKRLNQYNWFNEIYKDERYHRLFFVNKRIRRYLQSSIRIRKIIHSEKAREKLLFLLNKLINS